MDKIGFSEQGCSKLYFVGLTSISSKRKKDISNTRANHQLFGSDRVNT